MPKGKQKKSAVFVSLLASAAKASPFGGISSTVRSATIPLQREDDEDDP